MPQSVTLPPREEFLALSQAHTLVPVVRTVMADLETPVSAFLRVAASEPEAFLLESVEGGEHVGRYTFIGVRPYRRITARGRQIAVRDDAGTETLHAGDVFAELQRELSQHVPARLPGLPPFTSGAVGYFAYDVVRSIETLPSHAADELGVPDALLLFFDEVLAFDHVKKEIHLMVTEGARTALGQASYDDALERLERLESLLAAPFPRPQYAPPSGELVITPRTAQQDFLSAAERVKEYIRAGDVFQCVLSQRFDCEPGVEAFEIYRALRIVNPSPYMYFLRLGEDHIVGSSPELLVRVKDGRVEYRPIAGTRARGATEVEDRAREQSLRDDPKEVSEHIMLVDLGRNDVGRVSEFGSVRVTELMFIERYSHVMHLVSAIEGTLREGLHALDALRACFPAGTLSGAPKIRAMEIIDELEPVRRGVYGGAVVYADFSGNLDSCIAIRTLFMQGTKGYVQAGAGIVADSVPQSEFEECRSKAAAVFRAIERARE
jgi:anthranilate synthase component 1